MKIFLSLLLILINAASFTQKITPDDLMPVTKDVIKGKLDNGLTYYVRENHKPENRIFLRLAINAGSILENESQRGLAHLIEHMAFNGTKNFQKNELVNYLESIGMRFGADINAYTSFDETVYILELPADSPASLIKGFQILEDWAQNLSFDHAEIDKERGVVIEEWRGGRGAQQRMFYKQMPVLFKDSRYAERIPIGDENILKNALYDTLKQFYRDWYRPSLMAIVAVGDFDKVKMTELIKEHFSDLKNPQNPRERIIYPLPDQKTLDFSILSDPEATNTVVNIYHRLSPSTQGKVSDYRRGMVENLFNQILNSRLSELSQQADPPFLYGYSQKSHLLRNKDFFALGASVKEGGILRGMDALLTEAYRVKKYGFLESELQRHKDALLNYLESAYKEKDKTESKDLADELIRNFLTDETIPGIEFEYELHKQFLPGITLEEVNQLADEWIKNENTVVLVTAPEKKELILPTETVLREVIENVSKSEITPYSEETNDLPLLDKDPGTSSIVSDETNEKLGIREIELSNGVKVIIKPTDFKNDEVLFTAFSPGGTSLSRDENYIPASTGTSLVVQSGVGKFDQTALQKMLTGKVVRVNPYVGELTEGMSGSSSLKDIETMFQLIYLYFTEPRIDSSSFQSFKTKLVNFIMNRGLNPESVFQDTITATTVDYHYRRVAWNASILDSLDIERSLSFYKDRFGDASDFTFVFAGNVDSIDINGLLQKYIGTLPSKNREESWRDIGVRSPKGVVEKTVYKGIEPKSLVYIGYSGGYEWNIENNYVLYSMTDVLRIQLREALREDKGGTYGVGVGATPYKIPNPQYVLNFRFGCDPERVDEMMNSFTLTIDSLKKNGIDPSYVEKVKETQRREYEVNIKDNNYWLNLMQSYYMFDVDPEGILTYPERVEKLTAEDLNEAFNKYLDGNMMKFVLYPEKK